MQENSPYVARYFTFFPVLPLARVWCSSCVRPLCGSVALIQWRPRVHVLNVCVQSECPAFYKLQAMELITRSGVLQEAWVAKEKKLN